MSLSPGYANREIRDFVVTYDSQPHGAKRAWLAEQSFSLGQLRRWRMAVYAGDMDLGLVPRDTQGMTPSQHRMRTHQEEVDDLQAQIDVLKS